MLNRNRSEESVSFPGGKHRFMNSCKRFLPSFSWTTGVMAAFLLMSGNLFATSITTLGSAILNIGNGSVFVIGTPATGCVDWYNAAPPSGCQPAGTTGALTVQGGSTAPFTPGAAGTIQDLGLSAAFPITDFITIGTGSSAFHFDLLDLRTNAGASVGDCSGPGALAPSATCTPTGSPFQLTNGLANPVTGAVDTLTISLNIDANGYIGSAATGSNLYVGNFTTQGGVFGNIASVLATIGAGAPVTASWSATLTPTSAPAPIPEPAPFVLVGTGLMALGFFKRPWRKR